MTALDEFVKDALCCRLASISSFGTFAVGNIVKAIDRTDQMCHGRREVVWRHHNTAPRALLDSMTTSSSEGLTSSRAGCAPSDYPRAPSAARRDNEVQSHREIWSFPALGLQAPDLGRVLVKLLDHSSASVVQTATGTISKSVR